MTRISWVAAVIACAGMGACDTNKNNSAWSTKTGEPPASTAAASAAPAPAAGSGKGIGPVDRVDLASLDESRAPRGAQIFVEKCSACHKLEERYIGPALAGVTERRQPEWILNMILNPEVMVKQDPTAMALLATYVAPMANQNLTLDEAECLLVYFREHDEEAADDDEDENEEMEGSGSSASAGTTHGN